MEIQFIILFFILSVFSGLISAKTVHKFMDGKIEQWSIEYQVCGFLGAIVCVFSAIVSIGETIGRIISLFIG